MCEPPGCVKQVAVVLLCIAELRLLLLQLSVQCISTSLIVLLILPLFFAVCVMLLTFVFIPYVY